MKKVSLAKKAGLNLKRLIKKSKYKTQVNFSKVMGVNPTTTRRWIYYGINDINKIVSIAETLNIDFKELLK
ncbi:MAG: hypothetical protein E7177_07215 [Erysipelotrichaceae bacterium]|nr:hypothetical protein [Erysipelotrichaceae bacterium]